MSVSALEIYNEQLLDLSTSDRNTALSLMQQHHCHPDGRRESVAILNLTEHEMKSADELTDFIEQCIKKRIVSETKMNSRCRKSSVLHLTVLLCIDLPDRMSCLVLP